VCEEGQEERGHHYREGKNAHRSIGGLCRSVQVSEKGMK